MTTEVERITIAPRLTRQQVAHELGVTPKAVQNWTAKGSTIGGDLAKPRRAAVPRL